MEIPITQQFPENYTKEKGPFEITNPKENFKLLIPIECVLALGSFAGVYMLSLYYSGSNDGKCNKLGNQSEKTSGWLLPCYSGFHAMTCFSWIGLAIASFLSVQDSNLERSNQFAFMCDFKVNSFNQDVNALMKL